MRGCRRADRPAARETKLAPAGGLDWFGCRLAPCPPPYRPLRMSAPASDATPSAPPAAAGPPAALVGSESQWAADWPAFPASPARRGLALCAGGALHPGRLRRVLRALHPRVAGSCPCLLPAATAALLLRARSPCAGHEAPHRPVTLRKSYLEDPATVVPLGFFVRGEPYRLWGLIPWDRHFIGVKNPAPAADGERARRFSFSVPTNTARTPSAGWSTAPASASPLASWRSSSPSSSA